MEELTNPERKEIDEGEEREERDAEGVKNDRREASLNGNFSWEVGAECGAVIRTFQHLRARGI